MLPQLLAHLWGDYILQSDWMAQNKTKNEFAALVHSFFYTLPFLLLAPSQTALAVILCTHFVIDHFRLARYVVWAKNWLAPRGTMESGLPWCYCEKTGYPSSTPDWLAVWLLIIADNTLHLTINYLALRYL